MPDPHTTNWLRCWRGPAFPTTGWSDPRLGLLFPTASGPHLTAIIEAFEERHPSCEVEIREMMHDDPLGPLRRGEIDLMATCLPIDRPDIAVGPSLSCEPRVLQVARDHPLVQRDPGIH
jgi:DNA-binding transcriptional LysR family regulator